MNDRAEAAVLDDIRESGLGNPAPTLTGPRLGTLDELTAKDMAEICLSDFKHYVHGLARAGEISLDYAETLKMSAMNTERILRLALTSRSCSPSSRLINFGV